MKRRVTTAEVQTTPATIELPQEMWSLIITSMDSIADQIRLASISSSFYSSVPLTVTRIPTKQCYKMLSNYRIPVNLDLFLKRFQNIETFDADGHYDMQDFSVLTRLTNLDISGDCGSTCPLELFSSLTTIAVGAKSLSKEEEHYESSLAFLSKLKSVRIGSVKNPVSQCANYMRRLNNITELHFSNPTNDATLSKLAENLVVLNINHCSADITDVSISKLTRLEKLSLCGRPDISQNSLSCLVSLTELDLNVENCGLLKDSLFQTLTNITSLRLTKQEEITTADALVNNLRSLIISDCKRFHFSSVAVLSNLTSLTLKGARGRRELPEFLIDEDIIPIAHNLVSLYVDNATFLTDNAVQLMTNLTYLHLERCKRITVASTSKLTKLATFSSDQSNLPDAAIGVLTNLTNLYLYAEHNIDGSFSANMKKLRKLSIHRATKFCGVNLRVLDRLRKFATDATNISDDDIRPLHNLVKLRLEDFTEITDKVLIELAHDSLDELRVIYKHPNIEVNYEKKYGIAFDYV